MQKNVSITQRTCHKNQVHLISELMPQFIVIPPGFALFGAICSEEHPALRRVGGGGVAELVFRGFEDEVFRLGGEGVESRVICPYMAIMGVESRVICPYMVIMGVESRVICPYMVF